MIPTPHFLSIVFDTFYNYNTPVDMVTTSDIGVSVTIDDDKHIDEIVGVLRKYATITVEKNMVIVCVVGDLEWQNVGFEARIINALKDIPVRMISYGGSSSNVSLVMKAEDKVHALKALSEHLFPYQTNLCYHPFLKRKLRLIVEHICFLICFRNEAEAVFFCRDCFYFSVINNENSSVY